MPDLPDWQKYLPGSERYALSDLGELAVRLGSPVRYDRRGEVIWYDEFNHGLSPWQVNFQGNGSAVEITSIDTFMSANAALLTAGEASGRYAQLRKNLHPPLVGRWGVEAAIAFKSAFDYFDVAPTFYDGTTLYDPQLRISDTDRELQYKDGSSAWQKIASIGGLVASPLTYRLIKTVVDYDINEYVRLRFGPDEYDLSGLAFRTFASGGVARLQASLSLYGRAGSNDVCQVGHVIVTANEP